MSGVKGRSGRKPDAAVQGCRASINKAVSEEDWLAIWRALANASKEGNVQAARLLSEYCYGSPQAELPAVHAGTTVYYLPYRAGQPLPSGAILEQEEPPETTPGRAN